MRSFIKNIFIITATLTAVFGFALTTFAAGNIDSTQKFSQFLDMDLNNDGPTDFINWSPANGGATISDTNLSGYIWGETVGWINLHPTNIWVSNSCSDGTLGGYAWGENTGWINFDPTNATGSNHPQIDTATGKITGMAWAQNYGWIQLSSPETPAAYPSYDPAEGLRTTWTPTSGGGGTAGVCGSADGKTTTSPPNDNLCAPGGGTASSVVSVNGGWIWTCSPAACGVTASCSSNRLHVGGSATLKVITQVTGGTANPSDFTITIKENNAGVYSPFPGSLAGTTVIVNTNKQRNLVVTENSIQGYTALFSGDCDSAGRVGYSQSSTDNNTCTVTNVYNYQPVYGCKDTNATNYISDPTVIGKISLCIYGNKVCKDSDALNYNPNPALDADNTKCKYKDPDDPKDKYACKDPSATNYNADISFLADNSICDYTEDNKPKVCKDITALNYDSDSSLQADNTKCKYKNPDDPKDENHDDFLAGFKNALGTERPLWPTILGIIGLASSLPGVATRAGHMLMTFVWGRRKIRGIIYDSNTKEPLDPVYVSVIDLSTNQEVKNQLTDMEGRFGFVLTKGHYRITAGKTNYQFPSVRLAGRVSDEVYDRLYFGEPFTVENEEQVVSMNIPMDPTGTDWNQVEKHKISFLQYLIKGQTKFAWLFNALFLIGFLASVMITYFYPIWWNYLMTALYVVIALFQVYGHGPIHAGKVTKGGQPLAFGVVRVWSVSLNREIAKKVIESTGYYYILVPKSDYFLTIDERNPDGTYTRLFTSNTFRARNGVISKSFDL